MNREQDTGEQEQETLKELKEKRGRGTKKIRPVPDRRRSQWKVARTTMLRFVGSREGTQQMTIVVAIEWVGQTGDVGL